MQKFIIFGMIGVVLGFAAWIGSAQSQDIIMIGGGGGGSTKAISDSLALALLKKNAADSTLAYITRQQTGNRWKLPIPTKIDTSVALSGKDSLTIWVMGNVSAGIDSSDFLRAQGNGTAPGDTLGIGIIANSLWVSRADSFVVYARADTISTEVAVTITITGSNGNVIMNQVISLTVINAWKRFAFAVVMPFIAQDYKIVYKPRAILAHWIDVSPVLCK